MMIQTVLIKDELLSIDRNGTLKNNDKKGNRPLKSVQKSVQNKFKEVSSERQLRR